MIGMPRHLSQHVGGFILTERPLIETVPVGNGAMDDRTFIEWDKDDIEELGILKIDVLALGMLTCIRKAFDLIAAAPWRTVGAGDRPGARCRQVYDMLCAGRFARRVPGREPGADEHAAEAEAALLLRPGDRGGDRPPRPDPGRHGPSLSQAPPGQGAGDLPLPRSPDHGPPDELERILGRTLGVPIFQEQAMKIALDAARFSLRAEANQLRKAMATFRSKREYRAPPGQDGRADGGTRLRPRLRPALLRPDQGLRRIWLPRKPCGELRASGLRLELAQMEISGGVRLRAAQLRSRWASTRRRRSSAMRASMASRCAQWT